MSRSFPGLFCPADGRPLAPVISSTSAEVEHAVHAARGAQVAWAALSFSERANYLRRIAQRILEKQETACRIMSEETGRGPTECRMSELASTAEYVNGVIREGKNALRPEKVKLSFLDFPGKRGVVEPTPRGVVGIIAPWNYPVSNFYKSIWPALLAGNGVVMKPSEYTPRSGTWLHEQFAEILPEGLVGIVQGGGEVGAALIEAGIDCVVFTGSVRAGKQVARAAAERLIVSSLELGGKDAAIVLADCDLERTVVGVAQWSMHNAGQNCAGIERVYVEEAIADEFVRRLAKVVSKLRVAPGEGPTELGPLQNQAQLDLVDGHVKRAIAEGAELVCGGEPTGKGFGYRPTVLDRCQQQMQIVQEETFGPVVAVVRVPDAERAIQLANDSQYGLNGSIWTKNIARGEALARRLEVGVALVNNHSFAGIIPDVPWTGTKQTGPGVAASRFSYAHLTRPRTLLVDSSNKPDPFWFPANAELEEMSQALVLRNQGKLSALLKLAGLLGKRVNAIRSLSRGD